MNPRINHPMRLFCLGCALIGTQAAAAIFEYTFVGVLRGDISEPGAPETILEAPIQGVLALDTTSTSPEVGLDNQFLTPAQLHLLLESGARVSAAGAVGQIGGASGPSFSRSLPAHFNLAGELTELETSNVDGFPTTLTLARANAPEGALELTLDHLTLAIDSDTLFSLRIGDTAAGELLHGSLIFSNGEGEEVALDFTVTQFQRRKFRRYSPEWAALRDHVAEVQQWHDDDEFLLDILTPNNPIWDDIGDPSDPLDPTDPGDDDLDPIGLIPEPASVAFLVGFAGLLGLMVRRRR